MARSAHKMITDFFAQPNKVASLFRGQSNPVTEEVTQRRLIDTKDDKITTLHGTHKSSTAVNFNMILSILKSENIEVEAEKQRQQPQHLNLLVMIGLKQICVRCGFIPGNALVNKYMEYTRFWIPIVEAYLTEIDLFHNDKPMSLVMELYNGLPLDQRKTVLMKMQSKGDVLVKPISGKSGK